MKLANALSQRAELQTRIRQLEERLNNNAQVQEEDPAEDPMELLRELDEDYAQLEALIARINRTNSVTLVDGVPLSDLLARRDCMTGRLGILRGFLSSASSLVNRRTVGEIRIHSTVNVRELQKQVDQQAKKPAGAGRCHSGDKLDHRADGALTAKMRWGGEPCPHPNALAAQKAGVKLLVPEQIGTRLW